MSVRMIGREEGSVSLNQQGTLSLVSSEALFSAEKMDRLGGFIQNLQEQLHHLEISSGKEAHESALKIGKMEELVEEGKRKISDLEGLLAKVMQEKEAFALLQKAQEGEIAALQGQVKGAQEFFQSDPEPLLRREMGRLKERICELEGDLVVVERRNHLLIEAAREYTPLRAEAIQVQKECKRLILAFRVAHFIPIEVPFLGWAIGAAREISVEQATSHLRKYRQLKDSIQALRKKVGLELFPEELFNVEKTCLLPEGFF